MVQNIKQLIENFLGFNPSDIARLATKEQKSKKKFGMGGISDLIKIMENDLAVNTNWQTVSPDEDFPKVYESKQGYEYFVAPRTNYKILKLGPQKRKKYPIEWFYLYTIRLENDGLEIYDNYYPYNANKPKPIGRISEPLYNFIKHCDFFNIKSLTFRYLESLQARPGAKKFSEYQINWGILPQLDTLQIYKSYGDNKFNSLYIDNFPEEIYPKPLDSYKHITNIAANEGLISLWHSQFKDYNDYFWFVRKLIKIGFSVKDVDDRIYNADNIDDGAEYKLGGQEKIDKEQDKERFNENGSEYITNRLGDEIVEKYKKMINHISTTKSKKGNVYLYQFNTLRDKNKIQYYTTIHEIAKDNNIFTQEQLEDNYIKACIFYKMFVIMKQYELESFYKKGFSNGNAMFDNCLNGWTEESSTYSYYDKTVEIKELPIKFNDDPIRALYILYFTIGLALKQCKGIENVELEPKLVRYYDEYGLVQHRKSFDGKKLNIYNADIKDMSDMDMSFLDQQIINIVTKYCKKNKL